MVVVGLLSGCPVGFACKVGGFYPRERKYVRGMGFH